jgi:hypothetical protein
MRQIAFCTIGLVAASLATWLFHAPDGSLPSENAIARGRCQAATISVDDALEEARDYLCEGTIDGALLAQDSVSGALTWQVTAGPQKVHVDAQSGELVEITFF